MGLEAEAMNGELLRFAYLRSFTLGLLRFGPLELATVERPWLPNPAGPGGKPRESCVPDGTYFVKPWNSARFPDTYILLNNTLGVYEQPALIPPGQQFGRSAILIHMGNRVEDVIGCIAVGLRHSPDQRMALESRLAMQRLRDVLGRECHQLTIRPAGTQEIAA
jgi:Family of unknown function (DUF5675)